jgi:hypothetical protein
VLAVGLAQVPWILRAIRERRARTPTYLRWQPAAFERPGLFLWEAFVSGKAKGHSHREDAERGVETFLDALPEPARSDESDNTPVISLIGAALLNSGLSSDPQILSRSCLVLRSTPRTT